MYEHTYEYIRNIEPTDTGHHWKDKDSLKKCKKSFLWFIIFYFNANSSLLSKTFSGFQFVPPFCYLPNGIFSFLSNYFYFISDRKLLLNILLKKPPGINSKIGYASRDIHILSILNTLTINVDIIKTLVPLIQNKTST